MNLRLLQLGDSALPIGGYSHSWGLEAAIARGLVSDAGSLEQWVRRWLRNALAPCEGIVIASSCRAAHNRDWAALLKANELLWSSLAPPTLRHASRDMGEQLLALAQGWPWAAESMAALRQAMETPPSAESRDAPSEGGRVALLGRRTGTGLQNEISEGGQAGAHARSPRPQEWHHACVFATVAAAAGSSPADALAVYLHQATLGILGAGVRAIPVGHTHGQEILARLHGEIELLAGEFGERGLETAGSFCPAYEVLCDAQSHLYTRLFRS
jgi:urease accessory protein